MAEQQISSPVSFFLALMHSPYVGNTTIINGHSIYNALLCNTDVSPKNINKVSFGIPQNAPLSLKGSNIFDISVDEEPKIEKSKLRKKAKLPPTVLDNIPKHGYKAFRAMRGLQNIFTNSVIDYSPIPFHVIKTKHGIIVAHDIDYFVFYIVWNNKIPDINFMNAEFGLGIGRNSGFGFTRIERILNTTVSEIVNGVLPEDTFTAINGVNGICNHAKYGFGEFVIDHSKTTGNKLIKLVSPLCMKSSYPNTTSYGVLPTFVEPVRYEKVNYFLWDKGEKHILECIPSGKVFSFKESDL